jgi:uncharacterized iron-regulated protein
MRLRIPAIALLPLASLLAACAAQPTGPTTAQRVADLLPASLILLGEQHDAPEHQVIEREVVQALAGRKALAAVALEMAPAGGTTAGLAPETSEAQVQAVLQWSDAAWPWKDYGPAVMAAVRAGVPVLGANLPQGAMRDAMRNTALDVSLRGPALKAQQQRIREGHCGMLPESQIQPMTRIQIARDQRMAQTLEALTRQAASSGKTVLLIAGAGHVDRTLGIPQHLPADLMLKVVQAQAGGPSDAMNSGANGVDADVRWPTPPVPPKDYCAGLIRPGPASAPRPAPAVQ